MRPRSPRWSLGSSWRDGSNLHIETRGWRQTARPSAPSDRGGEAARGRYVRSRRRKLIKTHCRRYSGRADRHIIAGTVTHHAALVAIRKIGYNKSSSVGSNPCAFISVSGVTPTSMSSSPRVLELTLRGKRGWVLMVFTSRTKGGSSSQLCQSLCRGCGLHDKLRRGAMANLWQCGLFARHGKRHHLRTVQLRTG